MDDTSPATGTLRLERAGPIAYIIADNLHRMNALNAAMWEAVPRLVAEAERDTEVRVIVLRGAGERAFSAGADISEFDKERAGNAAAHYDALNDNAFLALSRCGKPTISMIHGFCLGGGLGLALCTDIRIADEQSQFAIPAAKLGIGYNPRWVRPLLAAVPPARAKELLFTGRRFKAEQALQMGLINEIVPPVVLHDFTRGLAEEIATNAPLTIRAAKLTVDELTRNPENPDQAALDATVQDCFDSEDYIEGRHAFLQKRKPQFKGR